ncbi:MAG: FAD-binding oxidoreductase, partial [Dehalococcoidia bacterium]
MLQLFKTDRMWQSRPLKDRYDLVIIGAGVQGLATAHYLGKLGVTNVALLDKGYLGGGASARSTAILRANYVTTEGIPFFHESLKLYEDLAQDLNYNLLFSQFGRLELAHTESSIYALRTRVEFNAAMGVESRLIEPGEIKELVPQLDMRKGQDLPILAGLYHPPAGVIRHDAVIWAYARAVDRAGAEVHPYTEVTGIQRRNGRVVGVETNRGKVEADLVLNCTAAWASTVAKMVGLELPIVTHPLQALVTEPLKPFLKTGISSTNFHVYVYQTDRGELVIGGAVDHYPTYSQRSTYSRLEDLVS